MNWHARRSKKPSSSARLRDELGGSVKILTDPVCDWYGRLSLPSNRKVIDNASGISGIFLTDYYREIIDY